MPIRIPIAEVVQMEAAVVRPRTVSPSLKMTPAPRKPMPVMMPWAMRVGSIRMASLALNQALWNRLTSMNMLDAMHTSACVRNPAARPWKLRSVPMTAPAAMAATMWRANSAMERLAPEDPMSGMIPRAGGAARATGERDRRCAGPRSAAERLRRPRRLAPQRRRVRQRALVLLRHERRGHDEVRRGAAARRGHVVEDRDAQERLDVGIVRLRLERIPEEDEGVELAGRDHGPDLLIPAER